MPTAIPIRSPTSEVFGPTGSQWPGMASREIAVITAVAASSSGMPAAISAPNTATSKTLALVCLTVALVGVPRLRIYGHDIFIALDGAWRVVNGQRPATDFFAQMGPAYYLLHAAGLRLAGNAAIGLGYSSTIAVAMLSVWSFVLLRRRMRPAPFFLACVFLALLTAAPFPLGHSPWQTSVQ